MTVTRATRRIEGVPALPTTDLTTNPRSPTADRADEGEATQAGGAFLAEARSLMAERQWRDACKMIEAAQAVRPSIEASQLLAVAATQANRRKTADSAIAVLRSDPDPNTATVNALAQVAIARRSYQGADILARQAIELDPHNADAWASLATSYAGLGWFDEAGQCLDRAQSLGMDTNRRWSIGRAVNRWGLTRTRAPIITGALLPFLGLLAIAIGITVPFFVREIRLTRIDERFASLAADSWVGELRLRVMHGISVFAIVLAWVLLIPVT